MPQQHLPVVAIFVASVSGVDALERATRLFDGIADGPWRQRLGDSGGPWLRLAAGGLELRLNTGAQAEQVVAGACAATEQAAAAERAARAAANPRLERDRALIAALGRR